MPGSATGVFAEADDYRATLTGVFSTLTVTRAGTFTARVARARFGQIDLFQARESLARVAFVSLPPEMVFISFSVEPAFPLIWRGRALDPTDIMLHGRGDQFHQRTEGPTRWGFLALSPETLAAFCKLEAGCTPALATIGRFLHPPGNVRKLLLRAHGDALRLAETRPEILHRTQIVRAMECKLGSLLARCVVDGQFRGRMEPVGRAPDVMSRFEALLSAYPNQSLTASELSHHLGVSGRTLHKYCRSHLGISAHRYVQLRRLNWVRAALRAADPLQSRVSELAQHAGFTHPGRFAGIYRAVYGETPVSTLRRGSDR